MKRLTNPVRAYAWGSRTSIASLRGHTVPSFGPEAELWMGAHRGSPSLLSEVDGTQLPLPDYIEEHLGETLGAEAVATYGPRLPFMVKLLAAAEPLSLQVHPDRAQAQAGFAAEQAAGTPLSERNYTDDNHKPEMLVALDDFHALCGFRDPDRTVEILNAIRVPELAPVVAALSEGPVAQRLRAAVELLMAWPDEDRAHLVEAVAASPHPLAEQLGKLYPGDVGVVVALLLNQVHLRRNEAVFMPAGNMHAYIAGFGVEVLAASDNVLRGGLTPKRVDVDELLRLLRYEVLADPVMSPVTIRDGLVTWPAPVKDFVLTKAEVAASPVELPGGGPRILCCVRGTAVVETVGQTLLLAGGDGVFVEAAEPAVVVSGNGAIVFQTGCES